ncbi:MAG: DUF1932 domain-containing protein [Jiangellaceae bacterium]
MIGILHPGEMGAAVARCLTQTGRGVLWASTGRSDATAERADRAGLVDAVTVDEHVDRCDVVFSICPPHVAIDIARSVGFGGIFVDGNAVSPATAREIGAIVRARGASFVDGGIIGPPPGPSAAARLYLSGVNAPTVAQLFDGTPLAAKVVDDEAGSASALKMAYAAWTKGTSALLLAIRAVARADGVEEALLREWETSLPELAAQSVRACGSATNKGWRWVTEMEQIAATFADAGLPDGFLLAAAEVYRRTPRGDGSAPDTDTLDTVLQRLRAAE